MPLFPSSNEYYMLDGFKNVIPFLPVREDFFFKYKIHALQGKNYVEYEINSPIEKPECHIYLSSGDAGYDWRVTVTNNSGGSVHCTAFGFLYPFSGGEIIGSGEKDISNGEKKISVMDTGGSSGSSSSNGFIYLLIEAI